MNLGHNLVPKGWSWQSLSQWGMFLQLALPGTVMMCMEWWSFEIVFFVSGDHA